MLKQVITGWNVAPGAPANWVPERDGDCGHLPVRARFNSDKSVKWCDSAWLPTPRELELLNAGVSLTLRVSGWQVPVALFVSEPD